MAADNIAICKTSFRHLFTRASDGYKNSFYHCNWKDLTHISGRIQLLFLNFTSIFFMKFLRFLLVGIFVLSAALSVVLMSPFLLLYWWIWAKGKRDGTKMVSAALAKRAQTEKQPATLLDLDEPF